MVNYNGKIYPADSFFLSHRNRAFQHGDALFEEVRLIGGKLMFWEDHYFRLMASMRMLRMKIPMEFTMEFLEAEIKKLSDQSNLALSKEIRITVFREGKDSRMTSNHVNVSYLIEAFDLKDSFYMISGDRYEVEIFKDFYLAPSLFSSLNRIDNTLQIVAGIFADDNGYNDCVLLNSLKNVVGTIKGSLFLVNGNTVKTPTLTDGANNTILRKKAIDLFLKWDDLEMLEESVSPFELQRADEQFILNDIHGVQAITKYRKKEFNPNVSKKLVGRLNAVARLG